MLAAPTVSALPDILVGPRLSLFHLLSLIIPGLSLAHLSYDLELRLTTAG